MFNVFVLFGIIFSILTDPAYANDPKQQTLKTFHKLQMCIEEKSKTSINCNNILQQLSEIKKEDLPVENQKEFEDLKAKLSHGISETNIRPPRP